MHLILPTTQPDLRGLGLGDYPMYYLGGPILGGGDWRQRMSLLLGERLGGCILVDPSWYQPDYPLYQHRLAGEENTFPRPAAWERYYMQQAAVDWPCGCLLFWVPCESRKTPRTDGNPYAMDTYGELGEWRGRMANGCSWSRVVVGIEEGFPGREKIAYDFMATVGPNFSILSTMEEVVENACFYACPPEQEG